MVQSLRQKKTLSRILVIGALGQLGTELMEGLAEVYGPDSLVAADLKLPENPDGTFLQVRLDVTDKEALFELIDRHKIGTIYNLAAILSANAEKAPQQAWRVNMEGHLNVLNAAVEKKLDRIFWPSSIAVFGKTTPRQNTPQQTVTEPCTIYGISKLAGERWCEYYHKTHGVDIRSLRYPGLIGYKSLPGGGTTDYAVDIYHKAAGGQSFACFLNAGTRLPMMFMPDAVRAAIELMQAPPGRITIRSAYNLTAFSVTPSEIAGSIRKILPDFSISYQPDYRQQIAESWPQSMDDSRARTDWNWKPEFSLDEMTGNMLDNLTESVRISQK